MILSAAALLLPALQTQPAAPVPGQADSLQIIAVEQTGRPPFTPEGRVYRLAGGALSRIRAGEILILRRPNTEINLGSMRVISVEADSALATLFARGETFPLRGDVAHPLAPLDIPEITPPQPTALKDRIAFPLNPFGIPPIPSAGTSIEKAVHPPTVPRTIDDIATGQPISAPADATQPLFQPSGQAADANVDDVATNIEQNPIYFLPGVSAISPSGIQKLQEWTRDWGRRGMRYFLAVPQRHLLLEQLLVDRLAGLQRELTRLGITNVEFRVDASNQPEPYDTIYVGIER